MNSTSGYAVDNGTISKPLELAAASFSTMGLLCCVQMFIMISITFRRRSGLYFWSLIGATSAQTLTTLSVLLQFVILKGRLTALPAVLGAVGFLFFPPLILLTLYSRLHLLQVGKQVLKLVLILIILEFTLAEFPMFICGILASIYSDSTGIALAYKISWEIEEAVFPVVDLLLCALYIIQVKKMWASSGDKTKGILRHVILLTFLLFLFDISYLVLSNTVDANLASAIEVCFPETVRLWH
jgi:hypothetical protein